MQPHSARVAPVRLEVWVLGAAAFVCTLAGGILALKLGPRIRLITGLSAGALLGLALFDLMPEAFEIAGGHVGKSSLMLAVGVGFGCYMVTKRALARLAGVGANHLGAASLTLHSIFDGLAIGLAFRLSARVGEAVAAAVLAHDLCDGMNTVVVALDGERPNVRRAARGWLYVNAAAPLAGIAVTTLVPVDLAVFAPLTAAFAGVFLYIGASELLPRSYAGAPNAWTSGATAVGMGAIYFVTQVSRS